MGGEEQAAHQQDDRLLTNAASSAEALPALLRFARRSVLVAAVLSLTAAIAAGYAFWQSRQQHVEASSGTLLHVARTLAQQTAREINEADQHLLRIVGAARAQPELLQDREQRERMMATELAGIAQAAAIAYLDPEGERHVYVRSGPRPRGTGFPGIGQADGIAIRDGTGKEPPAVFLHRRLAPRSAPQSGALTMRLSDAYFTDLYRTWRGQSPVTITLTTNARRAVAQYPRGASAPLKAVPALGTKGVERLADGTLRYTDPDGQRHLVATQAVPGYALTVHALAAENRPATAWSWPGALLAGALLALVLTSIVLARRYARELERRATSAVQHRAAESAIASEEARLQAMLATAPESMVVIDEGGIVERANPATEKMFGYPAAELVGRKVALLMTEPDRARHDRYLERYLKTGHARIIGTGRELTARRRDGTTFPIHLTVVEQRIAGQRRFIGTMRDITQSRLTDALLRAETRIATALSRAQNVDEVAADIVGALCSLGFAYGQWVVCTPVTRQWQVRARHLAPELAVTKIAPLVEGAAGPGADGVALRCWQSGEVIWHTQLDRSPSTPRDTAAVAAGLRACAALPVRSAGGPVAVVELFSASPDPRSPTLDSALGNIALQIGQMLSRLHAEQQLHTIIRTVPSAVFQARLGERRTIALTFMSAQIEAVWGVPADVALAHSRRVLWKVPRAYRRQLLQGLSEAVLQGEGWDVTVPVRTTQDNGKGMRWLRIHAARADEEGETRVWDGIISDVTEQKLAERQVVLLNLDLERRVEERTQELAGLNTELEAFADAVSHDLTAPLRGMRGYAEILKARSLDLPADTSELVDRIISQGDHMEQLIAALLELSRISRSELRKIATDMTEIATVTLQELQSRDPARTLSWSVEPGLRAYADPRLMRVVFENLLGNAWKFTRDRSDAVIEVGRVAKTPGTLFIRDNGAGFDQAYAEKLFQPFQRLHPASRFEGTGIGLATVQRIVRRHGGRIWAESTPDQGATFFFELPAQQHVNYTRGA